MNNTNDAALLELSADLGRRLLKHSLKLATAESCTGGWIAKCLTDIAGSSDWFERGFVTYSNAAKQAMLGVREKTLAEHGAVSEATVLEMATGALIHSQATIAVAVSGIAGPAGGTPDKPEGTVWIGWAWTDGKATAECFQFTGGREAVRRMAVAEALSGLIDGIGA
ncbi:MAG: nicotinamide-nucleotide amidase [Gammaproteobacteria bacterium]